MALEKRDSTQVVTWAPPLPQRAFPVVQHGTTTEDMTWTGTNGARFGYFIVDTSKWGNREGYQTPPVTAGEKFQLWTTSGVVSGSFNNPPAFDNGSARVSAENVESIGGAPDAFVVDALTRDRDGVQAGFAPLWQLKDPTVCTVAGVQQATETSWFVYFSPMLSATEAVSDGADGIITVPQPYNPRWLGRVGHVSAINYTYSLPGGPDQLTCALAIEPDFRTDAMNPGRIVTAHRGGSCIWEGVLTEPQPTATGWTITANGAGTYGTNFAAWWDMTAGSAGWTHIDAPVDYAVSRGLRWRNNGIGTPLGIWEGPVQDPGSLTVTDYLNLLCTTGAVVWELQPPASAASFPPGPWELALYDLPQDLVGNPLLNPNRTDQTLTSALSGAKWKRADMLAGAARRPADLYLVNTNPIPRTITADYNTVIVFFQAKADTVATSTAPASAAVFQTTFADIPESVRIHGRMEYFLDISNGGVLSRSQAAAIALNVLNKYIRANFAGGFTVAPGQLLNVGGAPVDLGCNWGGYVVSVQVKNPAMGGEVGFGPLTFVIGEYAYDDDTQTATVTPYQSMATDVSSMINMLYPGKFA